MSGIRELAVAARGGSGLSGARAVVVEDLRPGMVVALPFREFWLPWVVLSDPVPVSCGTAWVMLRRIRLRVVGPGVPVGVKFCRTAVVEVMPRHFGVCTACAALSPCVDEWVETTLNGMESRPLTVLSDRGAVSE